MPQTIDTGSFGTMIETRSSPADFSDTRFRLPFQ